MAMDFFNITWITWENQTDSRLLDIALGTIKYVPSRKSCFVVVVKKGKRTQRVSANIFVSNTINSVVTAL